MAPHVLNAMRLFTDLPGEPIELREYQTQAVEDLRASFRAGNRRLLLQAGTGSGKTIIAAQIIKNAVAKKKYVLFLAHRRELIDQCADKLERFGVPHGIIMAGRQAHVIHEVQVASIQTLWARAIKKNRMHLPPTDLIVLDECHRSLSKTYRHLIDAYPEATVLGLTATPCRGDGRGLGEIYDDMVCCPPISELTEAGFLVPIKYYAPSAPDLTGVKIRMGDYAENQLAERMDKQPLVGSIVENWGRLAEGRQTVIFAAGVKHSIHIAEEFEKAGVRAAHLDGDTPLDERAQILSDLWDGTINIVSNCMVLCEGWDCPPVSCCVIARPTKSLGLYLQMAGRTLRPWEGKDDCLLVDHAGVIYEHGFVDEPIPWDLDARRKIKDAIASKKKKSKPITCPECKYVFEGLAKCPECGWAPKKAGEEYAWIKGELVEVKKDRPPAAARYSIDEKESWYHQLRGVAKERGYKAGWIAHTYRKKFGVWPASKFSDRSLPPGPEVLGFVRHLMIKYVKRKAATEKSATDRPSDSKGYRQAETTQHIKETEIRRRPDDPAVDLVRLIIGEKIE